MSERAPLILVSACLAGQCCRYDGAHRLEQDIALWVLEGRAIPVCPEELGGLPTPRPPAEQIGDKVVTINGDDVTANYRTGAQRCLDVARASGATQAYLKSKSPMCGVGKIYDGTFKDQLIDGDGVLTKLLKQHGIEVFSV